MKRRRKWIVGPGSRITVLIESGAVQGHVRSLFGSNMVYDVWASFASFYGGAAHPVRVSKPPTLVIADAIDLEGVRWCRGWEGEGVEALRAVQAIE